MKSKSRILTFVFILSLLIFPNAIVFAAPHELNELNINVFIEEDGSAKIREFRKSNLSEGSESYIIINNVGDSEIIDFTVKESYRVYEYEDNWDINASRQEKTFKNGIIYTSTGYELAWGIGEYGPRELVLEYTITNFVKNFQETQGMFWEFVSGTNTPPKNMSLVIESNEVFNDENSNIWAFGFQGSIDFQENRIVANSSGPFSNSDHLTVLVELEEALFNTNSYVDMPFEEVKDFAFQNSDYGLEGDYYEDESPMGFFGVIVSLFTFLIPLFFVFAALFTKGISNDSISRNTKLKRKFKGEYYRDYPYESNFEDSFYLLNKIGATNPEMLITGFILKWINLGYIDIRKEEVGFLFKKEETSFKFIKTSIEGSSAEKDLYKMMGKAAGSNEILENNEFSKWSTKNYKEFQAWEKDAYYNSQKKMQDLGYIESKAHKVLFFTRHRLDLTEKGQIFEDNVYKFINFLHDFSIINEREAINVKLWDDLMIWAGLLGLTEVVNKEFKKLYPQYEVESHYRGNGVYTAYLFANSATKSYTAASAAAVRSSGGGGFSSGGGGGGSFGGGGGGTR